MELGPENDLSSGELFALAREEIVRDEDTVPVCLVALHCRPTRYVFDTAASLLGSGDPIDRQLGARVLRELGPAPGDESADRTYKAEATPLLLDLLDAENDPVVVAWAISALGYQPAPQAIPKIASFVRHPDVFVRFHVAAALPSLTSGPDGDATVRHALEHLTADDDADVRYYALSGLTEDLHVAADTIDATLRARLVDPDDQVRSMARAYLGGEPTTA